MAADAMAIGHSEWWRRAVIYEVYLRSFADGNGDGVGDIAGLRSRLPYLGDLGVDALWITPWYPSPMADGGYDVADYRDVDPLFGTLEDVRTLLADAHTLGIRILVDIVPNHTSSAHPWFASALAAEPGSPERRRYLFREGRGTNGSEPPNNWISAFGGPAWTRVTEPDGTPGQWYLHLFAPEQPDLDWTNPEVAADFRETLRHWFDLGIDGFRIDVAMSLVKDLALPDLEHPDPVTGTGRWAFGHPYYDRDEVHAIWRSWRAIADEYEPPRTFVGEVALTRPDRLARYLRRDELHTAFNFDFLKSPWDATAIRDAIDTTRAALGAFGAPCTWVLSNHDEPRHVTRLGLPETGWRSMLLPGRGEPDLALGTRRGRAAALLLLALPGGAYIYQGEELGLWYVRDIPDELLQDPTWERSGHVGRGRDGSRVPIPWEGDQVPFGFGPADSTPWLPQPLSWAAYSVEAESTDRESMLSLYRSALAVRRTDPGLSTDDFAWCEAPHGTLVFDRGGLVCAVNVSSVPLALPADRRTIIRSDGAEGNVLPPDPAEWFRTEGIASNVRTGEDRP